VAAQAVLVTGASGFIGRHLVAELRRRGTRVVAPPRRELGPETRWHDVLKDIGAVVHLAALAHDRAVACERSGNYDALVRANALGAEKLARDAAEAGVRQFIFLSSIGVHGEQTFAAPFREDGALQPASLYARSKLEAEQRLRALEAETGLRCTILRPTLVYGPGNPGNLLRLLRLVDRGWPLPFASVRNRRSLTYVGNLVDATAGLLGIPPAAETFIVCDAEAVSTPVLIAALAAGLGRPARLLPFPVSALTLASRLAGQRDLARRLLGSLEADGGRLQRKLGWRPPYSAAEALSRTGAWYGSQRTP
jgi:nucleoside-diphosphate-sugar epimerase